MTTRISYEKMKERCLAPISAFREEGVVTETPDGITIFKDNGANILAVAHLDTVVTEDLHFWFNRFKDKGFVYDMIYTPTLDDRLGAYLILDLLPQLGMKYDILLTEGEETGRSTAAHFKSNRQYNWMFQFDRTGTDVVSYQYEDKDLNERLKSVGFNIGVGSFTDICKLGHLGCKGFNMACAYYNNHSTFAYAQMWETVEQIQKFIKFYNNFNDVMMPHDAASEIRSVRNWRGAWYTGGTTTKRIKRDRWNEETHIWEASKTTANETPELDNSDEWDRYWSRYQSGDDKKPKETLFDDIPGDLTCEVCHQPSKAKSEDQCCDEFGMCLNCFFDAYGVTYDTNMSYAELYETLPDLKGCSICGCSGQDDDERDYIQRHDMCWTCLDDTFEHKDR